MSGVKPLDASASRRRMRSTAFGERARLLL
jgi:hypothetical protein